MSFNSNEAQEQQNDNFEVYIITTLDNTYRYTSHNENVLVDGNTYIAAPIKRSAFTDDIIDSNIQCIIQAPITLDFMRYVAAMPIDPVLVEIRKYYYSDTTNYRLMFSGEMKSIAIKDHIGSIVCAASTNILNYKVPVVHAQKYCNNVLYGSVCQAVEANFQHNVIVNVDNNDNTILTSPDFYTLWVADAGCLEYGIATFGNDRRMIVSHQRGVIGAGIIILHFPFRTLTDGDTITVSFGCDKSAKICVNRFNNLLNFTGMVYIPKAANPVYWGVD